MRSMDDVVEAILRQNGTIMKREEIIDQISTTELIENDAALSGAVQTALTHLCDRGIAQHPKRGYYYI